MAISAMLCHFLLQSPDNTMLVRGEKSAMDRIPNKGTYYMACSMSGQDEPNRVLCLAAGADKMELSCPLRTTHCVLQEKFL